MAQAVFLATKTVDDHLSRAYAQVGVGSRRELRLVWREREAGAEAAYADGFVAIAWGDGAV